ncbi:MAG: arginine--tRNA ligase [Chloroflexi bacterium RBG_13_50_21]|nr:MAG: arginine--tRNA ligase [Chloroflexi bacterium RBG_13_50_21]
MFKAQQQAISDQIYTFCAKHHLPTPGELTWKPIPFTGEWGISTSFFQLAAKEGKAIKETTGASINVAERAQELASAIATFLGDQAGYSRMEATKGYLNLYFSSAEYTKNLVDTVLEQGGDFGRGQSKGERVMIEYAQPNTHHSFHIGHFRNALLGEALARLVEFAGFNTIRATYPGDIGLGVITVLWIYQKFYQGQEPEGIHERGQWLLKIYAEAVALLEPKEGETPAEKAMRETYDAERREVYRKWDAYDPDVRELWFKTRQWSLDELIAIFDMLDIKMDAWFFESDADEPAKAIVEELVARGIAEDERSQGGAVVVRIDEKLGLKHEKYRSNIILRSDGTTLYLTKDLALAKIKFEAYHVERSIYVVDVRQSLHLQQAFKILEMLGFPQAAKCYHLGYGFVSLPEGAMSARRGRVVLFKDVADEAIRRVMVEIEQKNPDLPQEQRQEVAEQVGLGAMVFAMLSIDNNKDMVYDMQVALNFDGHTGPYIQNAHVRANSILKKGDGIPEKANFDYPLTSHEVQLIDLISRFPDTVELAAMEYRPLIMANYAYDLAATFHSFYHVVPVIQTEDLQVRDARLRLVAAARQALANALRLLDIEAPEVM